MDAHLISHVNSHVNSHCPAHVNFPCEKKAPPYRGTFSQGFHSPKKFCGASMKVPAIDGGGLTAAMRRHLAEKDAAE